ncbi:DoxX family protein [Hymenobacter radiodurans]|uniref:DoxX family protein n=1 Tax=Hymenobacter radiodurans TaxID=2496028 RepID=UPI001058516E|nr:DoxX family protein [Hymenobacter radiodurans]
MKPLLVLLGVFGLLAAGTYFWQGYVNVVLAGNGAMAAMLLFTGAAHFAFTKGMMGMLPDFLPAKKAWVLATGVLEIVAAVGLLLPALRPLTAWLLIAFFILILPGNIIAARRHLNYQTGTLDGPGLRYLWFRIPLQLFFIYWTWTFSLAWPSYLANFSHVI